PGHGIQPALQLAAVLQSLGVEVGAQIAQVEHAEGYTTAFEDVLVTAPSVFHYAQGLLLFGDVAQDPGPSRFGIVGVEGVAGDVVEPVPAFLEDLDRLALLVEGIFQPGCQGRQQIQQVHLAGAGQIETEHLFGTRIQVADVTVGLGHQHALVDGAQGADGVFQRVPRQRVVRAQPALLAQQAEQYQQRQTATENEQQQLAGLLRQQFGAQCGIVEQGNQLPVAAVQGLQQQAQLLLFGRQRGASGARRVTQQHQAAACVQQQP